MAAGDDDRQIAKAHVLGEHGEQRLDHARAKTLADHHAVDVAIVERAGCALDRQGADHAHPLADRDRQARVRAAAPGDQHGRLVERIGSREFRQLLAVRGERAAAAQHRAVQGANAQRRAQPAEEPRRRRMGGDRQRVGHRRGAVVAGAGDDRHVNPAGVLPLRGQDICQRGGAGAIRTRLGQNHRFRLDRGERGRRIVPGRFDDREAAGRAQRLDQIRCRAVGNDGERTLQRHGENAGFYEYSPQPCQSAVNGPSTRPRKLGPIDAAAPIARRAA